jgi:pyridoxal phosphate enzyme (YggS family)
MKSIAENFARLNEEIGRLGGPGRVTLVGVTKFQPIEKVKEALAAGIRHLGNNYAQEGQVLIADVAGHDVSWHFIGHVQSRKAKYLIDYQCLQSLDRLEVAGILDGRLAASGRKLDVLIEINVGGEAQKSGIAPESLAAFREGLRPFSRLRVRGLMAMPPPLEPVEARRPYFRQLRQLFESALGDPDFDCLSLGTSEDYQLAIEEGSTMVRLGTTLFGPRPPKS